MVVGFGALLLLAAAVVIWNVKWKSSYDVELTGLRFQLGSGNEAYSEPRNVRLTGEMAVSLAGYKAFTGVIEIDGEAVSGPLPNREITVVFNEDDYGTLIYDDWSGGVPTLYPYGMLYMNKGISEVVFAPFLPKGEPDMKEWGADDGMLIVAPATDRAQALAIANERMRHYLQGAILE